MKFRIRARAMGALGALGGAVLMLGAASAVQAGEPGFSVQSGSLVSLIQADGFYGAAVVHTNSLCGLTATLCNRTPQPPIKELTRSLSRGGAAPTDEFVQNAFDYVRNNVAVEFRYGLSKGGLETLVEQSGTPFDQADLLVALLRQGGVTANYAFGTISPTPAQFQAWTGLATAKAACQLLANGGIPAEINGSTSSSCAYSGGLTSVTMKHVWVSAAGKALDPSFKTFTAKAGVDVAAALGCGTAAAPTCANLARDAASPTGTYGYESAAQANYVQNLHEADLSTSLSARAVNLQAYIRANLPAGRMIDVVGGFAQDLETAISAAALPYASSAAQGWTAIPDQYRTKINIQFGGLNTTLYSDEAQTQELIIQDSTVVGGVGLYPVGTAVFTVNDKYRYGDLPKIITTLNPSGLTVASMTIAVDHPYAALGGQYMDETIAKTIDIRSPGATANDPIFPIGILHQLGANRGSSQKANGRMALSLTVEPAFSDIFAAWSTQATQAVDITDALARTHTTPHHTLGTIVGFAQTNNITDANTAIAVLSDLDQAVDRKASMLTTATLYGLTEGSVYEQHLDTSANDSAIALFRMANQKGAKFYEVTHANLEAVLARTVNYGVISGVSEKDFVRAYLNSPTTAYSAIISQNGDVGQYGPGGVMGTINIVVGPVMAFAADDSRIAYASTYRNKGGGGQPAIQDPSAVGPAQAASQERRAVTTIDEARGMALVKFRPDLVTGAGDFPMSLSFRRTLRTEPSLGATNGGFAETHSNLISVSFQNDAYTTLGQGTAEAGTSAIAAIYTLLDLNRAPDLRRRATGALTAQWLGDRFSGNVVLLNLGGDVTKFARLADGTFQAQGGGAPRLVQTGARTPYPTAYGFKFNYSNVSFQLTNTDGGVLDFGWATCGSKNSFSYVDRNCYALTRWTFPNGMWVAYDYVDLNFPGPQQGLSYLPPAQLNSIRNNFGRSLTWHYQISAAVSGFDAFDTTNYTVTDDQNRVVTRLTNPYDQTNLPSNKLREVSTTAGPENATAGWYEERDLDAPAQDREIVLFGDQQRVMSRIGLDSVGRVKKVVDGVGQTTSYFPAMVTGAERRALAQATNPLQVVTRQVFDDGGRPLVLIDGTSKVTKRRYDGLGRLVQTTSPEGDSEILAYDVRSNILTSTRKAKPGSTLADQVTATTFGEGANVWVCANYKTCNRAFAIDGPRTDLDDVANYAWSSSTGELIQALKPPEAGGARGQIDLGYTSYTAGGATFTLMTSKTEKVSASENMVTTYTYDAANRFVIKSKTLDPAGVAATSCYSYDAIGNVAGVTDARASACP